MSKIMSTIFREKEILKIQAVLDEAGFRLKPTKYSTNWCIEKKQKDGKSEIIRLNFDYVYGWIIEDEKYRELESLIRASVRS